MRKLALALAAAWIMRRNLRIFRSFANEICGRRVKCHTFVQDKGCTIWIINAVVLCLWPFYHLIASDAPVRSKYNGKKKGSAIILLIPRSKDTFCDPIMAMKLWHIEASLHSPSSLYIPYNPVRNEKWLNLQWPAHNSTPYSGTQSPQLPHIVTHPIPFHPAPVSLFSFPPQPQLLNKK